MFDPRKLMDMMKQATDMQQKFQEELKTKQVEGSAGGGMVRVKMNGNFEVLSLEIDDSVWGMQDKKFLQDMVQAAMNDATRSARDMMADASKSLLGKMGL